MAIIRFLKKQTCATVCCIDENGAPYCFNCFYVFDGEVGTFYLKSSPGSRHSALLMKNGAVAGTVLPDKLNMLVVQGIQFEGMVTLVNDQLQQQAKGQYYKKYPLALAIPGEIWVIRINSIKMTDSTLGFGKKVMWHRTGQHDVNIPGLSSSNGVLV